MATIDTFKAISGCSDDAVATYYVNKAKAEIKAYTKRNDTTIESTLGTFVIDLAMCYYNQKGAEGLESQSYSGVSEHYAQGIPQNIKTGLNSYRYFKHEEEVTT